MPTYGFDSKPQPRGTEYLTDHGLILDELRNQKNHGNYYTVTLFPNSAGEYHRICEKLSPGTAADASYSGAADIYVTQFRTRTAETGGRRSAYVSVQITGPLYRETVQQDAATRFNGDTPHRHEPKTRGTHGLYRRDTAADAGF